MTDRQLESDEQHQAEARELAITIEATKRMHNATDSELDDIASVLPESLFNNIMRSHLNEYSNVREHKANSTSIQLRMFAHDYFCKLVEKQL